MSFFSLCPEHTHNDEQGKQPLGMFSLLDLLLQSKSRNIDDFDIIIGIQFSYFSITINT